VIVPHGRRDRSVVYNLRARLKLYTTSMYIRWQSRKRRFPQFGRWGKRVRGERKLAYTREGTSKQDVHWSAILVENVRIDGKPTQRHVAYLAGFTDSASLFPLNNASFGIASKSDSTGSAIASREMTADASSSR
jgi:hypothetical protein